MSKEKKPSIYADRGTIGSADELDEYGVWVKSEPVDYSAAVPSEVFPDDAPDSDAQSDSDPDFDSSADLDFPVPENLPDFGDADSDDDTEIIPEFSDDEQDEENLTLADLDEFEFPDDKPDEEGPALADFNEFTDLDAAENDAEDQKEPDFTEIGLDELAGPDVLAGLSEESNDENPDEELESFSIDMDDTSDIQLMDDSEKKDELTVAFDDEDSAPPEPVADDAPPDAASQTAETAAHVELSKLPTQLLMKIAEELASIRMELANLKSDFAGIKTETPAEEPDHERTFFVEEEDEKIALTGDELNNILNTADFTEETGTDAAAGETVLAADEQQASNTESETFSIDDLDSGLDLNMDDIEKTSEEPVPELVEEISDTPVAEDEIAELDGLDLALEDDPLANEIVIESPSIFDIPEAEDFTKLLDGEESSGTEEPAGEDSDNEIFMEDKDFSDDFSIELDEEITTEEEPSGEADEPLSLDDLSISMPEEENPPEDSLNTEDLALPDMEDLVGENPTEPEETALDDLNLPDFELEAGEELLELTEKGALPMTQAPEPEDTEYLVQDPLVMKDFGSMHDHEENEAAIDLSGAVIDEPDLSLEIQDNPVEEPSLENLSIELEQEEPLPAEDDEFSLNLNLDEIPELAEQEEIEIAVDDEPQNEEFDIDEMPEADGQEEIETAEEDEPNDAEEDLALIPEGYAADEEEAPAEKEPDEEEDEIAAMFPAPPEEDDENAEEPAEEVFDIDEHETEEAQPPEAGPYETGRGIPVHLKHELKTVLSYMDKLLESLPDEKIEEFAKSDYFETYKKLFKELGLV